MSYYIVNQRITPPHPPTHTHTHNPMRTTRLSIKVHASL